MKKYEIQNKRTIQKYEIIREKGDTEANSERDGHNCDNVNRLVQLFYIQIYTLYGISQQSRYVTMSTHDQSIKRGTGC